MSDESWRLQSRCLGMEPSLFVPAGPGGSLKKVKLICNGDEYRPPCPVRTECHDYAVEHNSVGVFGGVMHSVRRPAATEIETVVSVRDWPGRASPPKQE